MNASHRNESAPYSIRVRKPMKTLLGFVTFLTIAAVTSSQDCFPSLPNHCRPGESGCGTCGFNGPDCFWLCPVTLSGFSDFNADGKTDILWRHEQSGDLKAWLMEGTNRSSGADFHPVGTGLNWRLVATGYFSADPKTDLLWQNETTGKLRAWLMDGTRRTETVDLIPSAPTINWKVAASGYFNSDGMSDIVWRNNATGHLMIWLMSGTLRLDSDDHLLGPVDLSWKIVGTGDFNWDGKADILWRQDTTGQLRIWLMNGAEFGSEIFPTPDNHPGLDWKVAGVGDFDRDWKPDLLWRNETTGKLEMWLMNGTTRKPDGVRIPVPDGMSDLNWRVVGR
jgi:VCBS repeat protein